MGLNIPFLVKTGFDTAFKITDSILVEATLVLEPSAGETGTYNPEQGTMTYPNARECTVKGLLYQTGRQKNADDAAFTNTFLIRFSDLIAQAVEKTPSTEDHLVINSVRWNITRVDPDIAGASYIIQLRRS